MSVAAPPHGASVIPLPETLRVVRLEGGGRWGSGLPRLFYRGCARPRPQNGNESWAEAG